MGYIAVFEKSQGVHIEMYKIQLYRNCWCGFALLCILAAVLSVLVGFLPPFYNVAIRPSYVEAYAVGMAMYVGTKVPSVVVRDEELTDCLKHGQLTLPGPLGVQLGRMGLGIMTVSEVRFSESKQVACYRELLLDPEGRMQHGKTQEDVFDASNVLVTFGTVPSRTPVVAMSYQRVDLKNTGLERLHWGSSVPPAFIRIPGYDRLTDAVVGFMRGAVEAQRTSMFWKLRLFVPLALVLVATGILMFSSLVFCEVTKQLRLVGLIASTRDRFPVESEAGISSIVLPRPRDMILTRDLVSLERQLFLQVQSLRDGLEQAAQDKLKARRDLRLAARAARHTVKTAGSSSGNGSGKTSVVVDWAARYAKYDAMLAPHITNPSCDLAVEARRLKSLPHGSEKRDGYTAAIRRARASR